MKLEATFRYTWDPRPEWVEALQGLIPPLETVSHLAIQWEPGTRRHPKQRWMLYERVPLAQLSPYALERFWEAEDKDNPGWRRNYRLLQEERCLSTPFWVIQGSHGGHPWRYTQTEQGWMRLAGLPQDPPDVGQLSYAEWDQRVLGAVVHYDRLQRAEATLRNAFKGQRKQGEEALRAATVKMLSQNVDEAMADAKWKIPYEDMPSNDYSYVAPDADAAYDRYIQTGIVE